MWRVSVGLSEVPYHQHIEGLVDASGLNPELLYAIYPKGISKSVEKKFEDEGEREVTCGGTEKLNLDV